MADWYVSSAVYATVPAFVINTSYSVGQVVKPISPALKAQWVFRVLTAGVSGATEPTWPTADNGSVTSGTAVFINVTGQSTWGWSAAAGDLGTLYGTGTPRFQPGDRVFLSSDHSETQTANTTYGSSPVAASYVLGMIMSVNRAGAVPPGNADIQAGATITVNGVFTFSGVFPVYHFGISFICTGAVGIVWDGYKTNQFDGCLLYLSGGSSTARFLSNTSCSVLFYNTSVRFSHASQSFLCSNVGSWDFIWLSSPNVLAAGSTVPTQLLSASGNNYFMLFTARGVNFSALTTVLLAHANAGAKVLLDSCQIAPGLTRYNSSGVSNTRDVVELINCFDGTRVISESWQPEGNVTTDRVITLSAGGAVDDLGLFSHKMISGTNLNKFINTLDGFWIDMENQAVGISRTATIELLSNVILNNDEVSVTIEYQGALGTPVVSFGTTGPGSVLGTPVAITSSPLIWNNSAGLVAQRLMLTFTPRFAGRVRGQVHLGRASTTVYYNPVIILT